MSFSDYLNELEQSVQHSENFQLPHINVPGAWQPRTFNSHIAMPTNAAITGASPQGSFVADISFRVVRSSHRINAALPVIFGAAFSFEQHYLDVLPRLIPANVTVGAVSIDLIANKLLIRYSDGVNNDDVILYGGQYNLFAFLKGLYSRSAEINKTKVICPNIDEIIDQVPANPWKSFVSTWLSRYSDDKNTMSLEQNQFQKNVFVALTPVNLEDEKGMALYTMPYSVVDATATYTIEFKIRSFVKK